MKTYDLVKGDSPLLISIPHAGTAIPQTIQNRFTQQALQLADTDWHQKRLYSFFNVLGASFLTANYSRYVVDLNRPSTDEEMYPGKLKTGLFPETTFKGEPIYLAGETPDQFEKRERIEVFWKPYHNALASELSRIKNKFGYAILYDAHSIKSQVPSLFEGVLPDLNVGTYTGKSCSKELENNFFNSLEDSHYSKVINKRFLGGFITRNYGSPKSGIHAIQMELTWKNYMTLEEYPFEFNPIKLKNLADTLFKALRSMLKWCEVNQRYLISGKFDIGTVV